MGEGGKAGGVNFYEAMLRHLGHDVEADNLRALHRLYQQRSEWRRRVSHLRIRQQHQPRRTGYPDLDHELDQTERDRTAAQRELERIDTDIAALKTALIGERIER